MPHKFISIGLVCVFFATSALIVLSQQKLTGELTITGPGGDSDPVTINGEGALSGRTVVSPLEIATPAQTTATILINGVGKLEFGPNSRMNLTFTDGKISGFFIQGKVTIVSSRQTAFTIDTVDGVVTAPNPELVNVVDIYFDEDKNTKVKPITGSASFNGKLISVGQIGGAGAQAASAGVAPGGGGGSLFTTILPVVSAAAGAAGLASTVADKIGDDEVVSPVR
jgi:hypothetical protein